SFTFYLAGSLGSIEVLQRMRSNGQAFHRRYQVDRFKVGAVSPEPLRGLNLARLPPAFPTSPGRFTSYLSGFIRTIANLTLIGVNRRYLRNSESGMNT